MRLVHWDNQIITLDRNYVYPNYQRDSYFKPKGLWVSDEDSFGWAAWCDAEEFDGAGRIYEHRIELYPDHNVLFISTMEELDKFHEEFKVDILGESRPAGYKPRFDWLDWQEVYSLYQGIVITPYMWERRMDYMWYYGWDCASGCIWDLHAIRVFEVQLKQLTYRKEDKLWQ